MQKWEYNTLMLQNVGTNYMWDDNHIKLEDYPIQSRLDEMGLEGWELAGVGDFIRAGTITVASFYFKRPIE